MTGQAQHLPTIATESNDVDSDGDRVARGLRQFIRAATASPHGRAMLDERPMGVELRCGNARHRLSLGGQAAQLPPDVVVVADELSVEAIFGGNLCPEDAWSAGLCRPWAGRTRDVLHLVALLAAIYA